jgi:hypothetical protein
MNDAKRFSLVKPTLDTPYQIDFDWWKQHDNNWRVFLKSFLCPEHQKSFAEATDDIQIDWIDPETAEITVMDGILQVVMSHCAKQPDFLTSNSALVDSVFKVFLANGNEPLTPKEIGEMIHRPPETILRTFSGLTVYKGIRPQHN